MAGLDPTLVPLAVGAIGVPLTFWRLYAWAIRTRTLQLRAEMAARIDAQQRLAIAETEIAHLRERSARDGEAE